jgi:hypothetical protein
MLNMKKIAGVALVAVSGLVLSLSANFATASAETANTNSSVVTEELCTWYMLGAPSSITLAPASAGTEYEGDAIEVSDTFASSGDEDLNVYSSGNVTSGSRSTYGNCTFYSAPTRPTVTMSIGDADFTATAASGGADNEMDFVATTGNELDVDETSSCVEKWTTTDLALKTSALSGDLITIPTIGDVDSRVTGTGNDRCSADFTVKINIPAGKTPTYPGQTYSWSGPTFTTALTTSNL